MDNRAAKKIYKIVSETGRYGTDFVYKTLKDKYKVSVRKKDVLEFISKLSKPKPGVINGFVHRWLFRAYPSSVQMSTILLYMKEHFSLEIHGELLNAWASKNGIKRPTDIKRPYRMNVSGEELEKMSQEYLCGVHQDVLAKKYGYACGTCVLRTLKHAGVRTRTRQETVNAKKAYDERMFAKIDSEEKAYILGLLLTDGNVFERDSKVSIATTDEDLAVYLRDTTRGYLNTRQRKVPIYSVNMYSKDMCDDLVRLSVVPRKSLTLQPPNLFDDEKKFIPAILRGVIDGDGYIINNIHTNKHTGYTQHMMGFGICGASASFIDWCVEELTKIGFKGMHRSTVKASEQRNEWYYTKTIMRSNLPLLKSAIYPHPLGMSRKYNIVCSMCCQEECSESIMEGASLSTEVHGVLQTTTSNNGSGN